jgi:methylenetetrahydrofolate reductase (NADPH)
MEWSLEILPKQIDQLELLPQFVKEIYIPSIPGSDTNNLVLTSRALHEHGKIPIPHIAARNLNSEREFLDLLRGLREANVDRFLLIAGSALHPHGPYTSTMDLLQTGILEDFGIKMIDVAGHPEGNPFDPDAELHLVEKVKWAAVNKIPMRIVTQWSFNPTAINSWIRQVRNQNITNSIHIGIPGPTKIKTLLNYAKLCGVQASAQVLKNQGVNLIKKFLVHNPDRLIHQLHGYDRLHLFTFGGLKISSNWLNEYNESIN